MFTSITWGVFLGAIFLIISGYYAITSLLLYSGELKAWVTGKLKSTQSPIEVGPVPPSDGVMGPINRADLTAEQRVSTVADQDIAISANDEFPEPILTPRQGSALQADSILVGSVADLLEEIKTLVQLIGEYKSSKAECHAFFHALFLRYPQLMNTTYQDAINLYILHTARDYFSFEVSLQDIASWWTTAELKK